MQNLPIPTHRRPSTPGEILVEEFLNPLDVSQLEFSKRIGVTFARVNEIARGKRAITPDTALRFAQALGTSAQFWMNLQTIVDLYDAAHSPEAKAIRKIKPVNPAASIETRELTHA